MCWALPHLQTFHLIQSPSSGSPGGSPSQFFKLPLGGSPSQFSNFRREGEAPAEPKINSHLILGSPGGSPSQFSNFRREVRPPGFQTSVGRARFLPSQKLIRTSFQAHQKVRPPSFQTSVGRARLLPSHKIISHLILGSPGGSPSHFQTSVGRFALPVFKLPLGGRGSCRAQN